MDLRFLPLLLSFLFLPLLPAGKTVCAACEEVVVNQKNERKCVRKANCCETNGIRLNCVVDPCLNFRRGCPRARHCVSAHCEKLGCTPFFYDEHFNSIQAGDCEVKILRKDVIEKARRRRQTADGQRKSLGFEIPTYHEPEKSEKLGNCPKNQMNEIIKACTDECSSDHECSNYSSKCCWNGCAKRCSRRLIKDPTNYLNLPLLSNDD
ncbi:Whey acidic protein-type 4-disulfide core domain-containing protein [Aphelenchoides fujianensis]|nr:Whey acidic protein-type 4-disulfide core domain-containing protein [Aphelenchoides fujianensis]